MPSSYWTASVPHPTVPPDTPTPPRAPPAHQPRAAPEPLTSSSGPAGEGLKHRNPNYKSVSLWGVFGPLSVGSRGREIEERAMPIGARFPGSASFAIAPGVCLILILWRGSKASHALPKLHGRKCRDQALLRSVRSAAPVAMPGLSFRERAHGQILRWLRQARQRDHSSSDSTNRASPNSHR